MWRRRSRKTYAIVRVAVQEDLATALAADIRANLAEITGRALAFNLQCILSDLVGKQTGGVLPTTQDEGGIGLLRINDSLLDLLVNGSLYGAHETGTHVNTFGTESQGSGKTLAIGEAARSDEGNLELLARTAEENEVGDIMLTNVPGTLKAINREEVDTQLHGRFGVADGGALVQNDDAGRLQLLDDGARIVSSSLDDLDSLIDNHLGVRTVVRRHEGGKEGQVDTEGVLGHFAASSNLLA